MKWITYSTKHGDHADGSGQVGVVAEDNVFATNDGRSLLELLEAGPTEMNRIGNEALVGEPACSLSQASLHSPLQPRSIRDFLSFLQHYRNVTGNDELAPIWNEQPAFYFSNPHSVLGPDEPVPISPGCEMFDFELEVGAVIGRDGSNLHPDEAEEYIAGYLIFCDWSGRDLQFAEMGTLLGPAKGKDTANTFGPMLVTAGELASHKSGKGYDLMMRAWVNDELVSEGSMSGMDWSFPEMVAYASRGTMVKVGDIIGSGTVPSGCLAEHSTLDGEDFRGWLQSGDRVKMTVDLLGTLDMTVGDRLPLHQTRATPAPGNTENKD